MNLCFCCENVDDLKKLDPFKWWNNVLQKVGDSVRVCQTLSLRERLGQNGDTEKQLFEKLGEWVRKPFQKPLPSQGEPWVELPNTQMVFYFLFQRTPISSKIWQRNVHLASRKSGAKKKSMGPKYSHTKWKGPSKQDHADGLVVVGAQQSQGGGVLSPAFNHKEEVWEEFTTRQGGAKGCRRRRMCERESLVYLIVNVVVFFFCVIRVGVQCLERCLWTWKRSPKLKYKNSFI